MRGLGPERTKRSEVFSLFPQQSHSFGTMFFTMGMTQARLAQPLARATCTLVKHCILKKKQLDYLPIVHRGKGRNRNVGIFSDFSLRCGQLLLVLAVKCSTDSNTRGSGIPRSTNTTTNHGSTITVAAAVTSSRQSWLPPHAQHSEGSCSWLSALLSPS